MPAQKAVVGAVRPQEIGQASGTLMMLWILGGHARRTRSTRQTTGDRGRATADAERTGDDRLGRVDIQSFEMEKSMASDVADLKASAERLRELHSKDMLVLPNAWDATSATIVAEAGFPVVATASNAVAAMLGYPDGEGAPWQEMFAAAGRIARAVSVPVTMDAEAGYGMRPRELVDRLLDIGVVGCNLEDTDHRAGGLVEAGAHAEWLAGVRAAADDAGVPIVVNARVDTFLPPSGIPEADRVTEAIRRGRLYREVGADCIYPIGVRDKHVLATLVAELPGPINGNTGESLDLAALRELGVARVSYGPRFYHAAMADLRTKVQQLLADLP
jgi:2-methylisocitrate lyase-like PEP mutase family enzyme